MGEGVRHEARCFAPGSCFTILLCPDGVELLQGLGINLGSLITHEEAMVIVFWISWARFSRSKRKDTRTNKEVKEPTVTKTKNADIQRSKGLKQVKRLKRLRKSSKGPNSMTQTTTYKASRSEQPFNPKKKGTSALNHAERRGQPN